MWKLTVDFASPSAAAICDGRRPRASASATRARMLPAGKSDADSEITRAGGSCSPAASIRATSWSISRNVRGGFGGRTRLRRLLAGLRSMCSSSIVVEDRREHLDQLLHRREPERLQPPTMPVAQQGAGGDRRAQLLDLAELALLERQAQAAVDLVLPVCAEDRVQVAVSRHR
jgi:hypothetical protein